VFDFEPTAVEEIAKSMVFCLIDDATKVLREKGLGKDREDVLL
jgi:hypothetical protein